MNSQESDEGDGKSIVESVEETNPNSISIEASSTSSPSNDGNNIILQPSSSSPEPALNSGRSVNEDGLMVSEPGPSSQLIFVAGPSTIERTPTKQLISTLVAPPPLKRAREQEEDGLADAKRSNVRRALWLGHDCDEARAEVEAAAESGQDDGGGGSTGKWLNNSTPKSGWSCIQVTDLGLGNGDKICEMCEKMRLRFLHTMIHPQHPVLIVGCICAEHMEGDQDDSPEDRENFLKNRSARRKDWLKGWKISKNGNPYKRVRKLSDNIHRVVIITTSGVNQWHSAFLIVDGQQESLGEWVRTPEEAKLAAFDHLFPANWTPEMEIFVED